MRFAAALTPVVAIALTHVASAAAGELDAGAFKLRRQKLMEKLGGAIAVLHGKAQLGGKKQDESFYYLTGVEDEGAVMVVAPSEKKIREYLFLAPRNPEQERWTGEREPLGQSIEKKTGFDAVYRTTALGSVLRDLAARTPTLAYIAPVATFQEPISRELEIYRKISARTPGVTIRNLSGLLVEMRAVKEPAEINFIRRATAISVQGHMEAMRSLKPGMKEFELKEIIEAAFRKGGARRVAYDSIVGSGPNGTILHARRDDRVMNDGELVVVDCGAEYENYASDVTRTLPVGGKFSAAQRKLYEIVLRAQKEAIAKVRPGANLHDDVNLAAKKVISDAGYADAFMHGTSHYVGLHVHDVGDRHGVLKPGMVITVEPGIYLAEQKLGIRIEDMVLVTENGAEVLSASLPKEPDAIEKAMAGAAP